MKKRFTCIIVNCCVILLFTINKFLRIGLSEAGFCLRKKLLFCKKNANIKLSLIMTSSSRQQPRITLFPGQRTIMLSFSFARAVGVSEDSSVSLRGYALIHSQRDRT